jgi:hypothetical protein
MTPLQDKLRAAFRETADEIPAEAPSLHLSPSAASRPERAACQVARMGRAAGRRGPGHCGRRGRPDRGRKPEARAPTAGQSAGPYGVPAYYVALITANPRSDVENQLGSSSLVDTAAELRSTQTGTVLAKVTPPKPYVSFTGVNAAGNFLQPTPQPRKQTAAQHSGNRSVILSCRRSGVSCGRAAMIRLWWRGRRRTRATLCCRQTSRSVCGRAGRRNQ